MIAIFLIILLSVNTSNALSGSGTWLVVSTGLMVLVWVTYVLTRKGYYRFANQMLLAVLSASILISAMLIGDLTSYNSLFYLFIVTLFAFTFLPIRTAVIVAAIQLLILFLFGPAFPISWRMRSSAAPSVLFCLRRCSWCWRLITSGGPSANGRMN